MSEENLGTGDSAGEVVMRVHGETDARRHFLAEVQHRVGYSMSRPADVFGHSIEELLDLAHSRHHGGDRVISSHSLERALTPTAHPIRLVVRDPDGNVKQMIFEGNARTNNGGIWQASLMGAGAIPGTGMTGTNTTAPTATTLTLNGVGAPGATTTWNDMVVHLASSYGVILSNTNAAPPVLTIDKWYDPANPGGAALATPASGVWHIGPGRPPSGWIALSTDATTEDIGNTTLTGEFTANFSTTGRWYGTYTLTTTPSGTGTTNSNAIYKLDAGVLTCTTGVTVNKLGLFHTQNGGNLDFVKKLGTAATLAINDTLDPSWAVTLS